MHHPALPEGATLLRPHVVAALFGVESQTLVDWETAGLLTATRTAGGHRRYTADSVRALLAAPALAGGAA